LFAVSTAFAQRDTLSSSPRDRLSIVAGFADSQHRDASVSPLTFDGSGYSTSGSYQHFSAHSAFSVDATWDAQRFRPQNASIDANERVMQGGVRVATMRSVGDSRGWMLSGGASAGIWGLNTVHQYSDPEGSQASFLAAFATVGPAVSVRRAIAGGSAQVQLDVPLFGFSDRSYSVAADQSVFSLRRIGPRELGAWNGAISYAPAPLSSLGLVFAYRFSLVNYHDTQPLRTASQSFSIGLSRYFGRGSP
jgi:hypothetical protein